jgi:hypothetical protein
MAARAASPPADSPQQPSPAAGQHLPTAAAAEQPDNKDAAQTDQLNAFQTGADAVTKAPPHAGNEADDSWQLCALTKVSSAGRGAHKWHARYWSLLSLHASMTMQLCAAGQDEGPTSDRL